MYRICSKRYMPSVVLCPVLSCITTFIFNIFVTSKSMYIVMMIKKNKKNLTYQRRLKPSIDLYKRVYSAGKGHGN